MVRFDANEGILDLCCDPTRSRPLFWARHGSQVAFASRVSALLTLPWVSAEPAPEHLAEYLSFRYVHAPATLLRDVFAVPPGHRVRISAAGVSIERWFDPGWSAPDASAPPLFHAARELDRHLRRSVQRRLPHDEPAAVMISGGLDSSAILFHAREHRSDILASTVALADDPTAETAFAARAASMLGVPFFEHRVEAGELIGAVERAARLMGQPLPSPTAVVQLLFFERLRAERRVVLGGDGGDEMLGGRGLESIAQRMRGARVVDHLPSPARALTRSLARRSGRRDLAADPARFGLDRLIGGSRVFKAHERRAILRDPGPTRSGIRQAVLTPLYEEVHTDPLNQVLHVWQRGWLAHDSLARSVHMSEAAGVEVRYPMLDRELHLLVNGWPSSVKVRRMGGRLLTKAPLREAMRGRLPDRLIFRPKRSMPAPLDDWLRGGGRAFLGQRIDALCEDPARPWNADAVVALARAHLSQEANHGLKLWTLILYQAWRDSLLPR